MEDEVKKMNKEQKVQVSDTTMMNKELMFVTKKYKTQSPQSPL